MKHLTFLYVFAAGILLFAIFFNLLFKEPIFSDVPWILIFTILAAALAVWLQINLKYALPVFFTVTTIGIKYINQGYLNWTSWIAYAGVAALYTAIFWLMSSQRFQTSK